MERVMNEDSHGCSDGKTVLCAGMFGVAPPTPPTHTPPHPTAHQLLCLRVTYVAPESTCDKNARKEAPPLRTNMDRMDSFTDEWPVNPS